MRAPTEQVGHRDGEWMFDGDDWVKSYANSKEPYVPQAQRGTRWWAFVLLLIVAAVCIAPPLARAVHSWIR